jgi:A/G-specific adenine glycosylase
MAAAKKADLKTLLWEARRHYHEEARTHLPWRATRDPYKILVSEVMLQQTQVERVIPYYKKFIRTFPSAKVLARVSLYNVLHVWQGLGYNRRAKFLQQAAKAVAKKGFPKTVEEMERLPGVGHYTARAVAAFAYNQPTVFVETNIRTVFFYHLPRGRKKTDKQLLVLVERALKESGMEPREFYAAMMDYGSHLKRQGIKLNNKSAHYVPQSKFEGSTRQLRGAILRELLHHTATLSTLVHRIPRNQQEVAHELARLAAEGIVTLHGRYFAIKE